MTRIYAMYFTGTAGSGHAVFAMKDGVIAGADALGVNLDGTYRYADDGKIDISVRLTAPPGTQFVTGTIAGEGSMHQEIKMTVPQNFSDGNVVAVQTPTGPVNVIFKYLRDVP